MLTLVFCTGHVLWEPYIKCIINYFRLYNVAVLTVEVM